MSYYHNASSSKGYSALTNYVNNYSSISTEAGHIASLLGVLGVPKGNPLSRLPGFGSTTIPTASMKNIQFKGENALNKIFDIGGPSRSFTSHSTNARKSSSKAFSTLLADDLQDDLLLGESTVGDTPIGRSSSRNVLFTYTGAGAEWRQMGPTAAGYEHIQYLISGQWIQLTKNLQNLITLAGIPYQDMTSFSLDRFNLVMGAIFNFNGSNITLGFMHGASSRSTRHGQGHPGGGQGGTYGPTVTPGGAVDYEEWFYNPTGTFTPFEKYVSTSYSVRLPYVWGGEVSRQPRTDYTVHIQTDYTNFKNVMDFGSAAYATRKALRPDYPVSAPAPKWFQGLPPELQMSIGMLNPAYQRWAQGTEEYYGGLPEPFGGISMFRQMNFLSALTPDSRLATSFILGAATYAYRGGFLGGEPAGQLYQYNDLRVNALNMAASAGTFSGLLKWQGRAAYYGVAQQFSGPQVGWYGLQAASYALPNLFDLRAYGWTLVGAAFKLSSGKAMQPYASLLHATNPEYAQNLISVPGAWEQTYGIQSPISQAVVNLGMWGGVFGVAENLFNTPGAGILRGITGGLPTALKIGGAATLINDFTSYVNRYRAGWGFTPEEQATFNVNLISGAAQLAAGIALPRLFPKIFSYAGVTNAWGLGVTPLTELSQGTGLYNEAMVGLINETTVPRGFSINELGMQTRGYNNLFRSSIWQGDYMFALNDYSLASKLTNYVGLGTRVPYEFAGYKKGIGNYDILDMGQNPSVKGVLSQDMREFELTGVYSSDAEIAMKQAIEQISKGSIMGIGGGKVELWEERPVKLVGGAIAGLIGYAGVDAAVERFKGPLTGTLKLFVGEAYAGPAYELTRTGLDVLGAYGFSKYGGPVVSKVIARGLEAIGWGTLPDWGITAAIGGLTKIFNPIGVMMATMGAVGAISATQEKTAQYSLMYAQLAQQGINIPAPRKQGIFEYSLSGIFGAISFGQDVTQVSVTQPNLPQLAAEYKWNQQYWAGVASGGIGQPSPKTSGWWTYSAGLEPSTAYKDWLVTQKQLEPLMTSEVQRLYNRDIIKGAIRTGMGVEYERYSQLLGIKAAYGGAMSELYGSAGYIKAHFEYIPATEKIGMYGAAYSKGLISYETYKAIAIDPFVKAKAGMEPYQMVSAFENKMYDLLSSMIAPYINRAFGLAQATGLPYSTITDYFGLNTTPSPRRVTQPFTTKSGQLIYPSGQSPIDKTLAQSFKLYNMGLLGLATAEIGMYNEYSFLGLLMDPQKVYDQYALQGTTAVSIANTYVPGEDVYALKFDLNTIGNLTKFLGTSANQFINTPGTTYASKMFGWGSTYAKGQYLPGGQTQSFLGLYLGGIQPPTNWMGSSTTAQNVAMDTLLTKTFGLPKGLFSFDYSSDKYVKTGGVGVSPYLGGARGYSYQSFMGQNWFNLTGQDIISGVNVAGTNITRLRTTYVNGQPVTVKEYWTGSGWSTTPPEGAPLGYYNTPPEAIVKYSMLWLAGKTTLLQPGMSTVNFGGIVDDAGNRIVYDIYGKKIWNRATQSWDYTEGPAFDPTSRSGERTSYNPITGRTEVTGHWVYENGKWVFKKSDDNTEKGGPLYPTQPKPPPPPPPKPIITYSAKGYEGIVTNPSTFVVSEYGQPEQVTITPLPKGKSGPSFNLWKVIEEQDIGSSDVSPISMRINVKENKSTVFGPKEIATVIPHIKRIVSETLDIMVKNGALLSGNPNQYDYQTRTTMVNALAPYIALKMADDSKR